MSAPKRIYKLEVRIVDEPEMSDDDYCAEVERLLETVMEAHQVDVTLISAGDLLLASKQQAPLA